MSSVNAEIADKAYDFFKEKANPVKDKPGNFTINQSDYQKFLKDQGVTVEMQKRIAEVKSSFTAGGIRFIEQETVNLIKHAKKEGQDPRDAVVRVRIATGPGDRMRMDGHAHKSYPDIANPGKTIDKFGVVAVKVQCSSLIDQDAIASYSKAVLATI